MAVIHAQENQHWYRRDGTPCYEVPYADGSGMRPATLRDARKLGLVPGVSGVSRCAAAPALERWKATQLLMAGLTLPRLEEELEEAWLERVWTDSKEQAKNAAARGTAIHASIQSFYEHKPWGEHQTFVISANNAINQTFGIIPWKPEVSFACPLGFGGKCDLSSVNAVADVKSKEFTSQDLKNDKQLAWDDHVIQLAAYRHGLGMPKARCANVFVSVNEEGLAVVHEWKEEELERGWRMFLALLQYWQAKNKYNSSWLPERVAA